MVTPILIAEKSGIGRGTKKCFFLTAIAVLLIQAGCKNESGITEIKNTPEIKFTNPPEDATEVAVGTSIVVTFNEEMDPSTITNNSFLVRLDTISVLGRITHTDSAATFVPDRTLRFGSTYSATITSDVQTLSGDAIGDNYEWSFTTENEPEERDTTSPKVTSTTPGDGQQGVSVDADLTATFNEPMNESTINETAFSLRSESGAVSGEVTYSANRATFSPSSSLDFEETYTAAIRTSAKDTSGNSLAEDYTWNFTTGAEPDNRAPTVASTTPKSDQQDVSINTEVTATFNEPLDGSTVNTSSFFLTVDGERVSGSVKLSGETITLTPSEDLEYASTYTVTITTDVEDLAGNSLEDETVWSFTTEEAPDITPPRVTSTDPTDKTEGVSVETDISATFSEPITSSDPEQAFDIEPSVSGSVEISDRTIRFVPSENLEYEETYKITVRTVVEDMAGNSLEKDYKWDFTTEEDPTEEESDDGAPEVSSTSPVDGATGVSVAIDEITATFSELMNSNTFNDDAFTLRGGDERVSGELRIFFFGRTARFIPDNDLKYSTTYTAHISDDVEDLAGNPLEGNYEWSFTTESPPDSDDDDDDEEDDNDD